MKIETKVADAFERLIADASAEPLQWAQVESHIRRTTRRTVITRSVAVVVAAASMALALPGLPSLSNRGIGTTQSPPAIGRETAPTDPTPTLPTSSASNPGNFTVPQPIVTHAEPPESSPEPPSYPEGALEYGSASGRRWWLTADDGEAFVYPDQRPLATPTTYCDEPGECVRLALEMGSAGRAEMTSYDVPAGRKTMEWISTFGPDSDLTEPLNVEFVWGAITPNVSTVRIELHNRPAVTVDAKRLPGRTPRYFFSQLRTEDRISAVVALDASGAELQRDNPGG